MHVETFSNKSHDFKEWSEGDIFKQLKTDADEALAKYGGVVQVRRPGHPLFGRNVSVSRVHLMYDEKTVLPSLKKQLDTRAARLGVELHFHHDP